MSDYTLNSTELETTKAFKIKVLHFQDDTISKIITRMTTIKLTSTITFKVSNYLQKATELEFHHDCDDLGSLASGLQSLPLAQA
jgi:hypothetical protein